jgi:hypothetical protein
MRSLFFFVLLSLSFCACSDDDKIVLPVCEFDDPAEDLPWLKEEIEGFDEYDLGKYFYVMQGEYNGGIVFTIDNCCPFCNTTPPQVFDCNGVVVDLKTTDISNWTTVWQADDSQCTN